MSLSTARRLNATPKRHASSQRPSSLKPLWWAYFPATLVAIVGTMIADGAFVLSLQRAQDRVEVAFQVAAQDRILFVHREVTHALTVVQDLASFFEASTVVERRDFRKFVGPVLKRHAGIRALQWISVVESTDRERFVARARRSFPRFQINDMDTAGELTKSPDRPKLYPVVYIQPYAEHKRALGLDMGTDPVVATLLHVNQGDEMLRVSPPMNLVDDGKLRTGVMIAIPVFADDSDDEETGSRASRARTAPRGFAVGTFYIDKIVARALADLRAGGVDIRIYQQRDERQEQLIHTHYSRLRSGPSPSLDSKGDSLSFQQDIEVGNQRWTLLCTPAPGRFATETRNSWIILAGGLAFTTLLTTYLVTLLGHARRVREEVNVRTAQLWETVEELNREVAERKSAERELKILNETLEQHIANRTAEAERRAQYLEQFAYVASHDLKAPLRAVSNLAGWIEEDLTDVLDDASREQMVLLRDRVQRMHNLIEGLLEYSRVGKTSESESRIDTLELITEIVDSLSPPKGFKIKVQKGMPTLYADRLQLGQVFSNLISNALTHHGDDRGKIRISVQDLGGSYEFSVCDDGQGIDPAYQEKVFMIFQTLASGDFENSTGIGLALVKKIVEESGGNIRLESTLGRGACFYFTWPKKRSADQSGN